MKKNDVLQTVLTRLFINVLAFGSSILTARFLGPAGRGDYFVVVTFAGMVMQFGNLGLQSSNTYYAARDPRNLGPLLANSLWISMLGGGGRCHRGSRHYAADGYCGSRARQLSLVSRCIRCAMSIFYLGQ